MMKRRKFLSQILAATAAASLMAASPAIAASVEDQVISQLREQGFESIRMSRTWLGRLRIKARGRGYEREIIINPRTGEILRDYWDDDNDAGLFSPDRDGDDNGSNDADDGDDDNGSDDNGRDDDGRDDDSRDDDGNSGGGDDSGGRDSDDGGSDDNGGGNDDGGSDDSDDNDGGDDSDGGDDGDDD